MITVKSLARQLQQEKYDVKSVPVLVIMNGDRYEVEAVDLYDDEVHVTVGKLLDDEVKIRENGIET